MAGTTHVLDVQQSEYPRRLRFTNHSPSASAEHTFGHTAMELHGGVVIASPAGFGFFIGKAAGVFFFFLFFGHAYHFLESLLSSSLSRGQSM